MSEILISQRDTRKTFIGSNRFQQVTYTNPSGSTATLNIGRLMGRVTANQKVLPQVAAATDGSQQPVGVLADDYTVAGNATITVNICIGGDIAQEKVSYNASEGLATVITNDVSIRDAIARNTQVMLVPSTENNIADNQ